MEPTTYECHNKSCTLGSRSEPGRFTGGISAEQLETLVGSDAEKLVEAGKYGEGFCPNCGLKGKEA